MRGVWRLQKLVRDLVSEDRFPSPHDPVAIALREVFAGGIAGLRPAYTYGVLRAAHTARALGVRSIWVAEFGVAAGGGLISLGKTAEIASKRYGVDIEVVGFDTGVGLPRPTEPRDAPFAFEAGDYAMDFDKLQADLRPNTRLVLGDVRSSVAEFMKSTTSPLGFASNDLDYYTSTMASLLPIVDAESGKLLPRVVMYFDDLIGYPYTTESAEWAAIRDLNATHPKRPIGLNYGLRWHVGAPFDREPWPELIYTLEVRDHPDFGRSERSASGPLSLT